MESRQSERASTCGLLFSEELTVVNRGFRGTAKYPQRANECLGCEGCQLLYPWAAGLTTGRGTARSTVWTSLPARGRHTLQETLLQTRSPAHFGLNPLGFQAGQATHKTPWLIPQAGGTCWARGEGLGGARHRRAELPASCAGRGCPRAVWPRGDCMATRGASSRLGLLLAISPQSNVQVKAQMLLAHGGSAS